MLKLLPILSSHNQFVSIFLRAEPPNYSYCTLRVNSSHRAHISYDWVRKKFQTHLVLLNADDIVRKVNRLKNLICMAETSASIGQWPQVFEGIGDAIHHDNVEDTLLCQLFVNVYKKQLSLDAATTLGIIYKVCTRDLITSDDETNHLQTCLNLLNPSNLLMNLYDPLMNMGLNHVNRLIKRCPDLVFTTLSSNSTYESHHHSSSRNGNFVSVNSKLLNKAFQCTILQHSLNQLNVLLNRNDMISVVCRFPAVLLRSPTEINEIHRFLTEEIGLESTDTLRIFSQPKHRHYSRHSTGLSLVKCPAWDLPITLMKARFQLLEMAGFWRLCRVSNSSKTMNADSQLAALLTCSPAEFNKWFLLNPPKFVNQNNTEMYNTIKFTKSDVKMFEQIFSKLNIDHNAEIDEDNSASLVPDEDCANNND